MSDEYYSTGPSRYICSVLEEIRKCHETRNYSYLPGLVEEAQVLANRMESGLYDKDTHAGLLQRIAKLKQELKDLTKKKVTSDGKCDTIKA